MQKLPADKDLHSKNSSTYVTIFACATIISTTLYPCATISGCATIFAFATISENTVTVPTRCSVPQEFNLKIV
jgi:hypothetical protein